MFYHSFLSDWNHGNAHFLRGVATELISRGHDICVFEPENSWSFTNLLAEYGTSIQYSGWLPNFEAPRTFAEHKVTVHVRRRPYVKALPGIPTIRPFEALASGIPLISSPWDDVEGLFRPGRDFLFAHIGTKMKRYLRLVLNESEVAQSLARSGLETIRARHTCAHRVDELLAIHEELAGKGMPAVAPTDAQLVNA